MYTQCTFTNERQLTIKFENTDWIDNSSVMKKLKIMCDILSRSADWILATWYSKNEVKNEWLKINC